MQECVAVEIEGVSVTSELEVEVDEHIVVTCNYTVHEGRVERVVFRFNEPRLFPVNQVDC